MWLSDAPKGFYKEDNTTPNDVVVLESKQNSDATGLLYQGGRKDPFTFATKSNGTDVLNNGLNPLKIYNAQGKEIVQTLNGGNDTNGGITIVKDQASSMLETVKNPNTYYATYPNTIIDQTLLTKDVYDYYWTSYSRGTDGQRTIVINDVNIDNLYMTGHTQQRPKSIYDPCPYGFRLPVNGTYNLFLKTYSSWKSGSYIGGAKYHVTIESTWLLNTGRRGLTLGVLEALGDRTAYWSGTSGTTISHYSTDFRAGNTIYWNDLVYNCSYGISVRCIEDC